MDHGCYDRSVTGSRALGRGVSPEVWGEKIPPRNKNFTGREGLLEKLRDGIASDVTAVVPHALHGMGGVGKTQVAVRSEERRVGKECRCRWAPDPCEKTENEARE